MTIAIDFDGTVVDHRFPEIGPDAPFAVDTLQKLVKGHHALILFTMRSGSFLTDAVEWFKRREIPLWGVQYNPNQTGWTSSNKCFAEMYIDDSAFGCPLIHPPKFLRPCVDWLKVQEHFGI